MRGLARSRASRPLKLRISALRDLRLPLTAFLPRRCVSLSPRRIIRVGRCSAQRSSDDFAHAPVRCALFASMLVGSAEPVSRIVTLLLGAGPARQRIPCRDGIRVRRVCLAAHPPVDHAGGHPRNADGPRLRDLRGRRARRRVGLRARRGRRHRPHSSRRHARRRRVRQRALGDRRRGCRRSRAPAELFVVVLTLTGRSNLVHGLMMSALAASRVALRSHSCPPPSSNHSCALYRRPLLYLSRHDDSRCPRLTGPS